MFGVIWSALEDHARYRTGTAPPSSAGILAGISLWLHVTEV